MIRKIRVGGIMFSGIRPHFGAIVNKTIWYCHKNRHVDKWNRIDSPEISTCTYGHLIHDKGGKNIQWTKDSFLISGAGKSVQLNVKRMKLEHSLTSYKEVNSNWIKILNIRLTTIKLLEENIGRTLFNLNRINILGDPYPKRNKSKNKQMGPNST